jgi:hypothetical protein
MTGIVEIIDDPWDRSDGPRPANIIASIKSSSLRWLHGSPAIVALKSTSKHITRDIADLMLKDQRDRNRLAGISAP